MPANGTTESSLIPITPVREQSQALSIVGAPAMRLQTLDLSRHAATAPDGRRYVVAAYDDCRLGRGYVTAVYPQQNSYLTLLRLMICEYHAETPELALERLNALVQAIQQGKLKVYIKANQA